MMTSSQPAVGNFQNSGRSFTALPDLRWAEECWHVSSHNGKKEEGRRRRAEKETTEAKNSRPTSGLHNQLEALKFYYFFFYYCSVSVNSTPFSLLSLHHRASQPIYSHHPSVKENPVCFLRKNCIRYSCRGGEVPQTPVRSVWPACFKSRTSLESLNRYSSTHWIKHSRPWKEKGALLIPIFLEPLGWRWLILEWFDWEHSRAPPRDGFQGRTWQKWD